MLKALLLLIITIDAYAVTIARVSVSRPTAVRSSPIIKTGVAKVNVSEAKNNCANVKSQKLYESFKRQQQQKPALNRADIDKMFKPDYRNNLKKTYYSGYSPTYSSGYQNAVSSNSSYGFWDYMMFNSLLDGVGDRQMYYHHQEEPEFKAWRSDAEKACADGDQEICNKLKDLDKDVEGYKSKNIKRDSAYITKGVDASIYMKSDFDISKYPVIRVCTGSISGDYNRFTEAMQKITMLRVNSVTTNGSIDNAKKISWWGM